MRRWKATASPEPASSDEIRSEICSPRPRERGWIAALWSPTPIDNLHRQQPRRYSARSSPSPTSRCASPEGASPQQVEGGSQGAEQVMARAVIRRDSARVRRRGLRRARRPAGQRPSWRLDRLPALFADAVRRTRPARLRQCCAAPPACTSCAWSTRGGGAAAVQQLEQTRARHIPSRPSEVLSDADAEARLLQASASVINGADFAELAGRFRSTSAARGGDLGCLNLGDTVPEARSAMKRAAAGRGQRAMRSPSAGIDPASWSAACGRHRRRKRAAASGPARTAEDYEDWLRQLRQHQCRLPHRARMKHRRGRGAGSSPSPAASPRESASCACAWPRRAWPMRPVVLADIRVDARSAAALDSAVSGRIDVPAACARRARSRCCICRSLRLPGLACSIRANGAYVLRFSGPRDRRLPAARIPPPWRITAPVHKYGVICGEAPAPTRPCPFTGHTDTAEQ